MKFYFKENNSNKNKIKLHSDYSFGSENIEFDYQISIGNSPFLLNFYKCQCIGCEGYIYPKIFGIVDIDLEKIVLSKKVGLYCDNYNTDKYGENINFNGNCIYDKDKKILLIGDWYHDGVINSFGEGQYINSVNGQIVGFLIKFY